MRRLQHIFVEGRGDFLLKFLPESQVVELLDALARDDRLLRCVLSGYLKCAILLLKVIKLRFGLQVVDVRDPIFSVAERVQVEDQGFGGLFKFVPLEELVALASE